MNELRGHFLNNVLIYIIHVFFIIDYYDQHSNKLFTKLFSSFFVEIFIYQKYRIYMKIEPRTFMYRNMYHFYIYQSILILC